MSKSLDQDVERVKEYATCTVCHHKVRVPDPLPPPSTFGTQVTVNCSNCKFTWKVLVGTRINL